MAKDDEFRPDWVSAPGDTIGDILRERDLSVDDFARQMKRDPQSIRNLLDGRTAINSKTARALERVLGASEAFWMTRESQFREDVTHQRAQTATQRDWLSEIPVKYMKKHGWIRSSEGALGTEQACLRFFDVPDVDTWRETYHDVLEMAAFRTSPSFGSQAGAVAAWLRQGEIEAASIDCRPWSRAKFQQMLPEVRSLTRRKDPSSFLPELERRCAECGVAVVILRAPTGCRASGATRFISPGKALIQLSFRYLSDDHFWFTFFHEAGHLVLHDQQALFLEGSGMPSTRQEDEANEFAERVLIPSEACGDLLSLRMDAREVIRFARRLGVSPGIVVGQLQHHERIKHNQLNSLKRRYSWAKE